MRVVLRDYQARGIDMVSDAYRAGKRAPLLVISTGGGKTICFAAVAERAAARDKRVLILAHRHELLQQASNKLDAIGLKHGVISPTGVFRPDAPCQIASVQTMVRRLGRYNWKPDLVVIDEAHLSIAPTYVRILSAYPNVWLLGVTATAGRLDRRGLGRDVGGLYDEIIQPVSMQALIDAGHLVKPRMFTGSAPDMAGVTTVRGDYDSKEAAARADRRQLIGDAVDHYRRLAMGRPTIAFCSSVAHAEHVAEEFRAAGLRATSVHGGSSLQDRERAISGLGNGSFHVVANCGLYIEGLDQPAIACVMLLSPTQSLTRYLQSVGRGLRPAPGKEDCIILDHAGCHASFGLPQAPREWSLVGEAQSAKGDSAGRRCPRCFAMNPSGVNACSDCGFRWPPVKVRGVETVDGDLREVEAEIDQLVARSRQEQMKSQYISGLIEVGKLRGYRDPVAWATHVYQTGQRQKRRGK